MSLYRHTAFFRDDDGHGWSETHDWDSASSTPIDLAARAEVFNQLMRTRRVPLLAADAYYLGCRVSLYQPNSGLKTQSFPIFLDLPDQGTKNVSTAKTEMDAALLAVKVTFADGAGTSRADVYLRGVWEQVITAGQLDFSGVAGSRFAILLKDYQDALVQNGYGWIGKLPTSPSGIVENYSAAVGGLVTFSLQAIKNGPVGETGQRKTFYFARINRSSSPLNRAIVCEIVTGFTVRSVAPIAAGPFVSPGTFYLRTPAFFRYGQVAYRKLSARKTGRPTGVGRGRLSARPVY